MDERDQNFDSNTLHTQKFVENLKDHLEKAHPEKEGCGRKKHR